eukprot:1496022-Rhodomonas_salina.2
MGKNENLQPALDPSHTGRGKPPYPGTISSTTTAETWADRHEEDSTDRGVIPSLIPKLVLDLRGGPGIRT